MKVVVGGLIAGIVLRIAPGLHSGLACLIAGALLAFLLIQLGPRSAAERIGASLAIGLLAWLQGPRAALGQSLIWYLFGWGAAGTALAVYLRPKAE